jgi:tetratricopeptide (TPR) repeat protein
MNLACTTVDSLETGHESPDQMLLEALALFRGMGDRHGEALTLANYSIWLGMRGRTHEALAMDEQVLAILREAGDRKYEGRVLGNIGAKNVRLGRLQQALAELEGALAIHREIGERAFEALDLWNRGLARYLLHADLARVREDFEQAEAAFREVGQRQNEPMVWSGLALVAMESGAAEEAEALDARVWQHVRALDGRTESWWIFRTSARVRRLLGRLDEAEAALRHGESVLVAQTESPERLLLLCERAHLELARGRSSAEPLAQVRRGVRRLGLEPGSEWEQALRQLQSAQEAFERGDRLVQGEAQVALPEALRRYHGAS